MRSAWSLLLVLAPLAAAAEQEPERSVPARPGGTLSVELDSGSVEIESHDENTVRVIGLARGSRSLRLSSDEGDVQLSGGSGGWLDALRSPSRLRVRVPRRYSVEVRTSGGSIGVEDVHGEVQARTSGAEIDVSDVVGDVEVETSGARVRVDGVRGELRARTSGSSIEAREIAGEIEARTGGGHIRLHDVTGPVEAETSGGSVSVRFTRAPEGEIRTSGGSIDVEFGADAGVDLEARTSGGRIELDRAIELRGSAGPHEVEGQIHGGGADLSLETSGGNIRIRAH